MTSNQKILSHLRETLTLRLSETELRNLCFDLGVDYDNLTGSAKGDKARELLSYLERRSEIHRLLEAGARSRPDLNWMQDSEGYDRVVNNKAVSHHLHLRVKPRFSGRTISWNEFKKGYIVDQNWLSMTPTTILTDVISDVYNNCKSIDSACYVKIINPNSFTSARFSFLIIGKVFQIQCSRELVRGGFPLNPFAAEDGQNYDVTLFAEANSNEVLEKIIIPILSKYDYVRL